MKGLMVWFGDMKTTTLLMSILSLILVGCTTADVTKTTSKTYAATNAQNIEMIFEKPTRQYEVIGYITGMGDAYTDQNSVFNTMKEKAAELGADAILIKGDMSAGNWYDTGGWDKKGSALAIKWK